MPQRIQFDGVSKTYGEGNDALDVLDNISFTVEAGEFVVVLGPSGCGKSTLLSMVDGLVPPTSGTITIGGAEVTEPRQDVAMVFQSFQLLPWRSVLSNVEMGLEIQGVPKDERTNRAVDWIERVGLDGFEDSYPYELSGGMQQRVGIARALAIEPDVLLLDEPFGALDAQTRDKMQGELLRLWEDQQATAVFITHDIDEAIYLADRVFVMSEKPASIITELSIDFERPRWKRRGEIEESEAFDDIKQQLREDLGLTFDEPAVTQ